MPEGLIEAEPAVLDLEVLAEPVEGELVPLAIAVVAGRVLLHCVVGEVHKGVADVAGVLLVDLAAQPDVALLEKVTGHVVCKQHPHSDVELPAVNQEWVLQVFLDYECVGTDYGGATVGAAHVGVRVYLIRRRL